MQIGMERTGAVISELRAAGCVFAEDETRLLIAEAASARELDRLVAARVDGEPLEYLLGWAEFLGMKIAVESTVFVPRRRTEFLALEAIACARTAGHTESPVVVDMCCGAGAIAAAVVNSRVGTEVYAADVDAAAARCARRNIGDAGYVFEGDLFDPLPRQLRGRVDVLVANAPYVPTDEIAMMPSEARDHEASVALDGGPDGLDVQRRIAAEAPHWLAPGGYLLVETSVRQAPATSAIFAGVGLEPRTVRSAEHDSTVVIGERVSSAHCPSR